MTKPWRPGHASFHRLLALPRATLPPMAGTPDTTRTIAESERESPTAPCPGLLLVFSGRAPRFQAIAVPDGGLTIGRDSAQVDDPHMSREHARITVRGGSLIVQDLGSRNGTYLNAEKVQGAVPVEPPGVLRLGETLFCCHDDVRPYLGGRVVVTGGLVVGPRTREVLTAVERAAEASNRLMILGETGSGKEMVAGAYHRCAAPNGALVPINCATLPAALAESLLFGAVRGAFSGATADRGGYLLQADKGVLFLDEVAELAPEVQSKLLRVIETGEVLALGSTRPTRVTLKICAATHQDLPRLVAHGKFRADLYYRLAQSVVTLTPLRERREEIPWFLANELEKSGHDLALHRQVVEACLLRVWPGNARALVAAIRAAFAEALAQGTSTLRPDHLPPETVASADPTVEASAPVAVTREAVQRELERTGGNVTKAAEGLGLHRTQLYRLLKRFGLRSEPIAAGKAEAADRDDESGTPGE